MAAYFQKNLRLLIKRLSLNKGKFISLEELSTMINISYHMLEQWKLDGEPSVSETRKIAEFFSKELHKEFGIMDILQRDLSADPYFDKVNF